MLSREQREQCTLRLWQVWAYHWSDEYAEAKRAVDGFKLARQIQVGRRGKRALGGDPLSDAVFVQVGPARVDDAWSRLVNDYQDVFEEEGRRVLGRRPDIDQWRDLATRLLVDRPNRPRIWNYRGHSSLRTWLRPIVRRHLLDAFRARRTTSFADEGVTTTSPTDIATVRESADWFRTALHDSLGALPVRDRSTLLLHGLRWSNGAIARRLGVSPGQASRIRAGAVARLSQVLSAANPSRFAELRDATGTDGRWFASILSEILVNTTIAYNEADKSRSAGRKLGRRRSTPAVPAANKGLEIDDDDAPDTDEPLANEYLPDDDAIHVVTPDERAPKVFDSLVRGDADARPTVVCLDARGVRNADDLEGWLGQFDARVNEQFNDPAADDPYEPQVAVIVTPGMEGTVRHLVVDATVLAAPAGLAAREIYRSFLVNSLGDLLHAPPSLGTVELESGAELPRHQTDAQADEWDARMRQLAEWSNDPNALGG